MQTKQISRKCVVLVLAAAALVAACSDDIVCAGDEPRFVEDPHELGSCGASWEPVIVEPEACEAACDPKPALEPVACRALDQSVPGGVAVACAWTFEVETPDGPQRGCCVVGGPSGEPRIAFAACEATP